MKKQYVDTEWQITYFDVTGNPVRGYDIHGMVGSNNAKIKMTVDARGATQLTPFQVKRVVSDLRYLPVRLTETCELTYIAYVYTCPLVELLCVSHTSLTPLKEKEKKNEK